MIDGTILNLFPPLIAAVLTYIVSSKKSRIQNAKALADIQTQAIQQVASAEERMRNEIWNELKVVREENKNLKEEMEHLRQQLESSNKLRISLSYQLETLEQLVTTYRGRIIELEKGINKPKKK